LAKYFSLVLTNAVPGQEDEFNRWYSEQHVPDVLAIPGIVAATRLRRVSENAGSYFARFQYMTLYELDTDDLRGVFRTLVERMDTAEMPMSSAIETKMAFYDWEALAPRLLAESSAGRMDE